MRRAILKFLKFKNLLKITILVILLYLIKHMFTSEKAFESVPYYNYLRNGKKRLFIAQHLNKIDWHNYTLIDAERKRKGLGEQGKPAFLPKELDKVIEQSYSVNGFNGALSDRISLERSLPDIRHKKCNETKYISKLPTVSVVVPFHNEHWSTLLRTVQSVIIRSPEELIKEIFIVDDASTKDFLGSKLEEYVKLNMPKVHIVRVKKRSGLITARLAGAKKATGDVIIFLDSHTEANVNWLPPLLEPIAQNPRTVVCPFIDVIAFDTFEYRAQDEGARGAFDWEFFYKRLPVLPKDLDNMPQPFESPVMAGGLFAINREFFWDLGGYDPGLDIWGGEQYELSFKVWQCGGRMLDAPCSRVGHIYRKFAPFPNPGHGDFVGKNYRRVAEVWMDEYAEYLYKKRPQYRSIETGNLTEQRAVRTRLKCKPFKWFMDNVAFDLMEHYPLIEPPPYADGTITPNLNKTLCLDGSSNEMEHVTLKKCTNSDEQKFIFSWHKDIKLKMRNMCWDLPESKPGSPILLYQCHLGGGNQLWRFLIDTKQIKQGDTNSCLDYDKKSLSVMVNTCDEKELTQKWIIENVNETQMDQWDVVRKRVTGPINL